MLPFPSLFSPGAESLLKILHTRCPDPAASLFHPNTTLLSLQIHTKWRLRYLSSHLKRPSAILQRNHQREQSLGRFGPPLGPLRASWSSRCSCWLSSLGAGTFGKCEFVSYDLGHRCLFKIKSQRKQQVRESHPQRAENHFFTIEMKEYKAAMKKREKQQKRAQVASDGK